MSICALLKMATGLFQAVSTMSHDTQLDSRLGKISLFSLISLSRNFAIVLCGVLSTVLRLSPPMVQRQWHLIMPPYLFTRIFLLLVLARYR